MVAQPIKIYYSAEEYLRLEENSPEKHEYFQGEIFLMAGATPRHNLIVANVTTELNLGLRGKACAAYSSDTRIMVKASNSADPSDSTYTYADASVVCGEVELMPGRNDTITNPIVIVEVLSPSTEKYDRSEKFELYRGLKSVQTFLIIDQARPYVELHEKIAPDKWTLQTFTLLEQSFRLAALDLPIVLANLYDKVKFER